MTKEQFKKLSRGDIVRHKSGGASLLIDGDYGTRKTAIRTIDLINPSEWDLVFKANYMKDI